MFPLHSWRVTKANDPHALPAFPYIRESQNSHKLQIPFRIVAALLKKDRLCRTLIIKCNPERGLPCGFTTQQCMKRIGIKPQGTRPKPRIEPHMQAGIMP